MSRPYPAVPAPIALFDTLAGSFDPVAGVPALRNGTGIENQRYIVSRSGPWNFVTGAAAGGAGLIAGDEAIYIAGVWNVIQRGATGDYLRRDGSLPMTGPLDTAGSPVLLRQGLLQGTSDAARAIVRYVELAAGSWAARTALLQVRARVAGNPATVALLPGELAVDLTQAAPPLLVGINGAGDVAVLIGAGRQVETGAVDQLVAGHKTFRDLSFGLSGVEARLPAGRGDVGQALVQQAGGAIAWGSVQLSADVQAIALTGGASIQAAFNASGPYVIGQSSLVFITWSSALYVWAGGPGTFGLGATPAAADDFEGPILSFAGVAFASLAELQAATVTGKAIDPAIGGAGYLVKDGADQGILSNVIFAGLVSAQAAWRFLSGSSVGVEAGARLTVQDAPRTGTPGLRDAVNRTSLDARFQPTSAALGGQVSGLAPVMDTAGLLNRGLLPFQAAMDYQGGWSPLAPGAKLLRNVAGGGCTPAASPGTVLYATADGRWNFTTGLADPSGTQVLAGSLLLLDGANVWFAAATPGGGTGGTSTAALPRDGSLPMTGNLTFASGGLKLRGFSPNAPLAVENVVVDGGTF